MANRGRIRKLITAGLAAVFVVTGSGTIVPTSAEPNVGSKGEVVAPVEGQPIQFYLVKDGKGRLLNTTYGTELSEAITANKIILGEFDRLDADVEAGVIPNSVVTVSDVEQYDLTVVEAIPFDTAKQKTLIDCETYTDNDVTVREGKAGFRNKTFTITTVDGVEQSRNEVSNVVASKPVNKITAGCKKPEPKPVAPEPVVETPAEESEPTDVVTDSQKTTSEETQRSTTASKTPKQPSEPARKNTSDKQESETSTQSTPAKKKSYSGTKYDWMRAAGIAESDWEYVDYIVTKESGWRPHVWNTAGSGAYGLCQNINPSTYTKYGDRDDPVAQLKWCNNYAESRYGGWYKSYNAWRSKNWW